MQVFPCPNSPSVQEDVLAIDPFLALPTGCSMIDLHTRIEYITLHAFS